MAQESRCVAVYNNHLQAEKAMRLLLEKGFDVNVHGDQGEVERAYEVLAAGDARDITIHLG